MRWQPACRQREQHVQKGWDVRVWGLWELKGVLLGRARDFGTCCLCENHTCAQRLLGGRLGPAHPSPPHTHTTLRLQVAKDWLHLSQKRAASAWEGRVGHRRPPASLAHVPHRPRTRASPPSRPTRTTCAGRASCSSSCTRSPRALPCAEASRPASTGSRSSWRS